ncbi:MAG: A/G-specific adenine glycosylase [Chitinophagales bacterium]
MRTHLLPWYNANARDLPWINEPDPYRIWLCEVIMQQTRVEQGIPFYQKFISAFPTVHDLALAKEENVLKLWEGMGYYSRARNLHFTAKTVVRQYNGNFPDSYALLLKLKGIGPYIAAAILSFTWNKPYPVIDSNVNRIITRYFGIHKPLHSREAHKEISKALNTVFIKSQAARFNQAMMDFGSLVCRPVNPDCAQCPVSQYCFANKHHLTDVLPFKQKKKIRRDRFFHFIVLRWNAYTVIEQRTGNDIWKNLYQFPLVESDKFENWEPLRKKLTEQLGIKTNRWQPDTIIQVKPQQLTHQTIHAAFCIVPIKNKMQLELEGYQTVSLQQLKKYTFPGIIRSFLNELV